MKRYKKIPFSDSYLPEIKSGRYHLETEDGRRVEFLEETYDPTFPISGLVYTHWGDSPLRLSWMREGCHYEDMSRSPLDLVIITDELMPTFKQHLESVLKQIHIVLPEYDLDKISERLLETAKGELSESLPEWKKSGRRSYPVISDNHEIHIDGWKIPLKEICDKLPKEKY